MSETKSLRLLKDPGRSWKTGRSFQFPPNLDQQAPYSVEYENIYWLRDQELATDRISIICIVYPLSIGHSVSFGLGHSELGSALVNDQLYRWPCVSVCLSPIVCDVPHFVWCPFQTWISLNTRVHNPRQSLPCPLGQQWQLLQLILKSKRHWWRQCTMSHLSRAYGYK